MHTTKKNGIEYTGRFRQSEAKSTFLDNKTKDVIPRLAVTLERAKVGCYVTVGLLLWIAVVVPSTTLIKYKRAKRHVELAQNCSNGRKKQS